MSLIEQVDKWIIKMFKFNERETNDTAAFFYPEGVTNNNLELFDELIYGHFSKNNKTYYFTDKSIIITNGQTEYILLKEIIGTNGSFRSEHKNIYLETTNKKINIKISDFPYRIQQLFYQLIEHHSSLIIKPIFTGPLRLFELSSDLSANDFSRLNISNDTHTVNKSITLENIKYHGIAKDNYILPDEKSVLIVKGDKDNEEVIIFNSLTDGYNSVTGLYGGASSDITPVFNEYTKNKTRLILTYNYSIDDNEFDELVSEIGLKSKKEINDLFGDITISVDTGGKLIPLTTYETQ